VSDLIPAKGEPSAYSFLDSVNPNELPRRLQASGVFYKVETIDIDDRVQAFGPTQVELNERPQIRKPGRQLQRIR
jgi:hypothetical protein